MDIVFQIIFFCFMSFIALWSGMCVALSFTNEDMDNNTLYGSVFFGSITAIATAANIMIYQKTNNITITVLSIIICLFIIIPIIAAYFRGRKRIAKRWADQIKYKKERQKPVITDELSPEE